MEAYSLALFKVRNIPKIFGRKDSIIFNTKNILGKKVIFFWL
jgi:hypothetical protein